MKLKNTKLILIFVLLLFSCKKENDNSKDQSNSNIEIQENSNKLNFSLNNKVTHKELIKIKIYEQLARDEKYVKYIDKLWETSIKFRKGNFLSYLEISSDVHVLGELEGKTTKDDVYSDVKKISGLGKLVGKIVWKGLKGTKSAYKMIQLEEEQKELYVGFSKEKQKKAQKFEKGMMSFVSYACNFPENKNIKKSDLYTSFMSLGQSIKKDDELLKHLEPIIDNFKKFLIKNVDLKTKLILNKIYNSDKQNYSILVDYGNKIIKANGKYKVNVDNKLLRNFYSEINITLNSLNNENFKIPIKDWSEEKQKNYNFILNDIKSKIQSEVNSLNF